MPHRAECELSECERSVRGLTAECEPSTSAECERSSSGVPSVSGVPAEFHRSSDARRSGHTRNIDPTQLVRVVFVWWCGVQNRLARRI